MAPQIFNDGSSGSVVIRSGPPASSGGSGGGAGGGGVSGGFGRTNKKQQRARKRAIEAARQAKEKERLQADAQAQAAAAQAQAHAQAAQTQAQAAAAQAQELSRLQALQQFLAGLAHRHDAIRAEVDRSFAAKADQLAPFLEHEIAGARRPPETGSSERWQLYTITKGKNEIDGLIAHKTAELNAKNAIARSFDGHDPFTRTSNDYLTRLGAFGQALNDGHQIWESAYNAAHEARLLSAQLNALTDKSNALARHHAEQTVVWREREAVWETLRQFAEQRDARVRFKQQADEDVRIDRVRRVNTLTVPVPIAAGGGMILTREGVLLVAQDVAAVIEAASQAAGRLLGDFVRIAARTGPAFVTAMVYSPTLGNGELTPEQRRRLFHSVGVPAQALGLSDSRVLQSIADAGGSVEVAYRLKPETVPEGTAIIAVSTGGQIGAHIPVINAVLDPLTGAYNAEIPGYPGRQLQFTPQVPSPAATASQGGLAVITPQVQNIPEGADLRIQDCIVCVQGLRPTYFSFGLPTMGSGVVTGTGQPAGLDWWKAASQASGAAIPVQIGDQFRGREINSFVAFDEALWRTVGEYPALVTEFDEVNKKRIEQGFAPYAPKSTWVGDRREFELRYQESAALGENPFNLDKISITTPQSAFGQQGILPAIEAWPIRPVGVGTWTPLVPPGIDHLGPTTFPLTPPIPAVYPGTPVIPVLPQNETFPAVDEGQIGASIPGYPADMELPSPDVLFLDRRDDPGTATGAGADASHVWLGEAARGKGAPIPSQIADQLRGREFANFHRFREAFWKAVAADSTLSTQFNATNVRFLRKGNAPFPIENDQYGGRVKYELHHQLEIAQGGAVYDMDNIVVMTPRRHVLVHKGGQQL
ncbi:S-type pyocin domain-containing protein [Pseudomonas sp. DR48]|uniref:S-type pyocin domain-containing protein n=1 Tax=Pseudomonas sp. DR48 TaxID=2871095 RepID=UPI001C991B8B|nr:S-type pyocin domain-containing protein [Pseudomonas sp. DR48]QZP31919.1 S-type pyocin domain-containing protein [Pseudomonas sp. DR48]